MNVLLKMEVPAAFIVTPVRLNENTVRFGLMAPDGCEIKKNPSRLIFVIDRSGSMSGGRLNRAKVSMKKIKDDNPAYIITFDTRSNYYGLCKEIPSFQTGGSTNFVKAYDRIWQCIQEIDDKDITVVFISDGEHNQGGNIEGSAEVLGISILTTGKSVTFKVIGVGGGADSSLLLKTSQCGTREGSYYYFNESVNNWESELDE